MLDASTCVCLLPGKIVKQLLGSRVQPAGQLDSQFTGQTFSTGMTKLAVDRYPGQMTLRTGTLGHLLSTHTSSATLACATHGLLKSPKLTWLLRGANAWHQSMPSISLASGQL